MQLQLNYFDLVPMSMEDGPEPISSYPISAVASSDILQHTLHRQLVTYTEGVIEVRVRH